MNKKDGEESVAQGRPNILDEGTMLQKIKDVIIGIHLSGAAISRKMFISIGEGDLKANNPDCLSEFGGYGTLTENWARGVLKYMNWIKQKGTTGKVEPCEQFLSEEKFTFRRSISSLVYNHDIPSELILNLGQTPLSYVCPGK